MASLRSPISLKSVHESELIESEIARLSGDSQILVSEDADGVFSATLNTPASVYTAFVNRGASRYCVTIGKTNRIVTLYIDPRKSPRWIVAAVFSVLSLISCVAVGILVSARLSE